MESDKGYNWTLFRSFDWKSNILWAVHMYPSSFATILKWEWRACKDALAQPSSHIEDWLHRNVLFFLFPFYFNTLLPQHIFLKKDAKFRATKQTCEKGYEYRVHRKSLEKSWITSETEQVTKFAAKRDRIQNIRNLEEKKNKNTQCTHWKGKIVLNLKRVELENRHYGTIHTCLLWLLISTYLLLPHTKVYYGSRIYIMWSWNSGVIIFEEKKNVFIVCLQYTSSIIYHLIHRYIHRTVVRYWTARADSNIAFMLQKRDDHFLPI